MAQTKNFQVNSEEDAWLYWENKFGSPKNFVMYNNLLNIEMEIIELENERQQLNNEIASRDINFISQYKINRSIELYFILKVADKYYNECVSYEMQLKEEFDNEYSDYNLFTRNYEKD